MLFKLYKIKGKFKFTRKNSKDGNYCSGCPCIINLDHKCTVDNYDIVGAICFSEFISWTFRGNDNGIVYHPSQRYDTKEI